MPAFAEADFRKASMSEPNGNCVRVARRDGWVAVRDDKVKFGGVDDHRLLLDADAFDEALEAWCAGQPGGPVQIVQRGEQLEMRLGDAGPSLQFARAEIEAFLDGVAHGEFRCRSSLNARQAGVASNAWDVTLPGSQLEGRRGPSVTDGIAAR